MVKKSIPGKAVSQRIKDNPKCKEEILTEAVLMLFGGSHKKLLHGKLLIREYIKATIGFPALAERISIPKQSIMRMLSATGNPTLNSLDQVLSPLMKDCGMK
jgi:DNA-binding phage protein